MAKKGSKPLTQLLSLEWQERIVEWYATMSPRGIARRLVEEGQPEIHYSTIIRFLERLGAKLKQPATEEHRARIEVIHSEAIPAASPEFRRQEQLLERSLSQLDRIDAELTFLSSDSDHLIYETGPLIEVDGHWQREFILDESGHRRLRTPQDAAIWIAIDKKRIQALTARQSGIRSKAGIHVAYARLELLVKPPDEPVITADEADRIALACTPDEAKAIEAGDSATFALVRARVR